MKPLAKPAIEAVKKGRIKFYPARWTKVYLNWMENIQDWCISRQIWWGHRIPVYYCNRCEETGIRKSEIPNPKSEINPKSQIPNNKQIGIVASENKPEKCPHCGSAQLEQDPDVLDTWFSSWLWPFSTFGWPKENAELKYFYPTNSLITAQEIIFFWVARMIMAGLEFMKDIPFRDVYIHGTVRDDTGKKMSKSLGNVIDPLEIIEEFGCDALRFSLVSITASGQDVFLSKKKFEIGRNFANKLWNASRFILMNLDKDINVDLCQFYAKEDLSLADRWILSRLFTTTKRVTKSLDAYRFNEAAATLYDFIWHQFCDWYIEISKADIKTKNTQIILYKVLEKSLRMLHPFMPFITEEIWQNLPHKRGPIIIESIPHLQKDLISKKDEEAMQLIIDLIISIRNVRHAVGIPPASRLNIILATKAKTTLKLIEGNISYLKNLARIESVEFSKSSGKPKAQCASGVVGGINFYIPLAGLIDVDKEKKRLETKIEDLSQKIDMNKTKLGNRQFLSKAPKEVIEKIRKNSSLLEEARCELEKNLGMLK
jgi:valyl-tRNA synthetase